MSGKKLTEKILVDTNLLIYSVDENSVFHERTIEMLEQYDGSLSTTSKNLSEFISVTTRKITYSLSIEDSLKSIEEFVNSFDVLFPDNYSFRIFQDLLIKYSPAGLRIHDFEIVSIAMSNSIKKIATINVDDFKGINEIEIILI